MSAPDLLASVLDVLDEKVGVDCLWLFGSHAVRQARPDSDVDIAALFRRSPSPIELLGLREAVAECIGRPVDLVDLDRAAPPIAAQVLRNGRLLLDRAPSRRVRFTAALPARYQDVERLQAPILRAMTERLAHG